MIDPRLLELVKLCEGINHPDAQTFGDAIRQMCLNQVKAEHVAAEFELREPTYKIEEKFGVLISILQKMQDMASDNVFQLGRAIVAARKMCEAME